MAVHSCTIVLRTTSLQFLLRSTPTNLLFHSIRHIDHEHLHGKARLPWDNTRMMTNMVPYLKDSTSQVLSCLLHSTSSTWKPRPKR